MEHMTSNSPSFGKEAWFGAQELLRFLFVLCISTALEKNLPPSAAKIPPREEHDPKCLSLNFDMAYVKDNLWLQRPRKVLAAGVTQLKAQSWVRFPLGFEDCDYN